MWPDGDAVPDADAEIELEVELELEHAKTAAGLAENRERIYSTTHIRILPHYTRFCMMTKRRPDPQKGRDSTGFAI